MKIVWTYIDIIKELTRFFLTRDKTKIYHLLIGKKETKEMRNKNQNNMFHWLFGEIGKHLWYKTEDVKGFFMKWLFWTKEIELFWQIQEIAIINSTTDLKKEQAILLIDSILQFIQKHNIPCKYSSREIDSLYDSYN
jgi:hypothetical protein